MEISLRLKKVKSKNAKFKRVSYDRNFLVHFVKS